MLLCRRADVLPVEIVVRGYLAGSGWKDYVRTGEVSGVRLPAGLRESERLPEPIVTPSTKAEQGTHDEPIDLATMADLIGDELAARVCDIALALYDRAASTAAAAGIIVADTKFEMGLAADTGELLLVDEVLTPDSSRFWEAADLGAGPRPGLVRQAVRARLARAGAVGQARSAARRSRPTSSPGRARGTSRRTSGSPARASTAT